MYPANEMTRYQVPREKITSIVRLFLHLTLISTVRIVTGEVDRNFPQNHI